MRLLAIATVARSLVLQAPIQWTVARQLGFEITFAAVPDGYEADLSQWGSFVAIQGSRRPSPLQLIRNAVTTRDLLTGAAWDVVQVQSPIGSAVARMVLPRRRGFCLLYVVHGFHFQAGDTSFAARFARFTEWALRARTDRIMVISNEDYDAAVALGYPAENVTLSPGAGVRVSDFPLVESSVAPGRMLFVGDLNRNKDPLLALGVLRELAPRDDRWTLTCIGSGPLEPSVRAYAREHNLEDRLEVLPRTNRVPDYMQQSVVLLSCSRREGLPRVVIEALASGLPVVARVNRGTAAIGAPPIAATLSTSSAVVWADTVQDVVAADRGDARLRRRSAAMMWDEAAAGCVYAELLRGAVRSRG